MIVHFFDFFTDPILRAPTWGTLFMCVASALMGVVVLLKKRSLLTESLSHASYPGAVIGICLFALFFPHAEEWIFLPIFLGALFSSFLALKAIHWLEEKMAVRSDAALSLVLALFFGVGVVVASGAQTAFPKWYQAIQMLLFGQAATMSDLHIVLYAFLALAVALFLFAFFSPLQAALFDRNYAASLGVRVIFLEKVISSLLLFSLIIGMRSVGVILMAGMTIAPAVAARQLSDRLQTVFGLAALFGALSGLFGNILSVCLSLSFSHPDERWALPTGPVIVLVGTLFALLSLAFAPKRGLLFRLMRIARFRLRCLRENFLKEIWKKGALSKEGLKEMHRVSSLTLFYILYRLQREGWIARRGGQISLTEDGEVKARSIVRLHRLWELYLTEELGLHSARVHRNAEEMEHILTPDLEKRLTHLLLDPKQDPHQQPIPEGAHQ